MQKWKKMKKIIFSVTSTAIVYKALKKIWGFQQDFYQIENPSSFPTTVWKLYSLSEGGRREIRLCLTVCR